ncbi:Dolichyl-diphosphooligosaccharide-protein glycosyltransferase 48kDa subunit [Metschnikowia bicuspidata var. bicuspidata NRRL YB-4993]|uniref:Dolichyl-diphosphooligosaccharide--protein glycosyltransferase subunit WBP1 n=1 Tax=Metschnikowia bicuspidata var. bicuspidata NRRL YB-4993 TaxID=869754 RepID=A0A1A0H7I3_9ASCO|nr:Dolichyl-diphosphooligosaccharide-protein glycosyltransferase 48kDa subunit [Metschnikowia bicuspidata var. bicuspidata NRRL YB-4993]OBA19986.1 Dolichyl-diphosphooligosaccharide-protein glycosyltransferase 48kDa subunit [Metschnikowia bicuspidata var. bicuspidata NRRL YB-4993]
MFSSAIAKLVAIGAVFCLATAANSADSLKPHVLVAYDSSLVPDLEVLEKSILLDSNKYEVNYLDYLKKDEELLVTDEARYDHAIFLPSSKKVVEAKGLVDKHKLLEFFNLGGNIIAVGSSDYSVPEEVRLLLAQVGIHPAPRGFTLSDHFDTNVRINDENLVSKKIISQIKDLNYEGTAALVSNSQYLFPLVKAPKFSFTSSSKDKMLTSEKTWTVGEQGFLAVAFQGLNNARGAWVGSLDLLSDDLTSWVLQEKGVLRLNFVEHYKQDEPGASNRTLYRIKDSVYYTVGVSELNNGEWVPYTPSSEDDVLQLSFKMLDPYQRLNMTLLGPAASTENGVNDINVFFVEFVIPDHHGMFTFELDYKREGLSFLEDKKIVAVRHLANDEYKRSWEITNAWMYMVSAALVVIAWLIFVAGFLYLGVPKKIDSSKETQKKVAEK